MILSQQSIARRCQHQDPMIEPFIDHQVRGDRILSYGLSSFGYDVRCISKFKIFNRQLPAGSDPFLHVIDPTAFNQDLMFDVDTEGDALYLMGRSYALSCTFETFQIPRDIFALVIGKSTLARCGLLVNATPLEPGWRGQITLELSNLTDYPIRIYPGMGIAQVVFFQGDAVPEVVYDTTRKYQDQVGVVTAR